MLRQQTLNTLCKEAFGKAVKSLSCPYNLSKYTLPYIDPERKFLSTEYLTLGDPNAKKWLVVSSGSIGVDFYLGSELQTNLLQNISEGSITLPKDIGIFIIHGINPWGSAWIRPGNINNVVLNMNCSQNFNDLVVKEQANEDQKKLNEIYKFCERIINTMGFKPILYHWPKTLYHYIKFGKEMVYKSIYTCQRHQLVGLSYGGTKEQPEITELIKKVKSVIPKDASLVLHIDLQSSPGRRFEFEMFTEDSGSLDTFKKITEIPISEINQKSGSIISGVKLNSLRWKSAVFAFKVSSRRRRFRAMRNENILHCKNIWIENWSRDEISYISLFRYYNHYHKQMLLYRYYYPKSYRKSKVFKEFPIFIQSALTYLSENER